MTKGSPGAPEPLQIDWVDGYEQGKQVNLSIIFSTFDSDPGTHTEAWQAAVLSYKAWLGRHKPQPSAPSGRDLESEGLMAVGLENIPAFNLSKLDAEWHQWNDVTKRIVFWGQVRPSFLPCL